MLKIMIKTIFLEEEDLLELMKTIENMDSACSE